MKKNFHQAVLFERPPEPPLIRPLSEIIASAYEAVMRERVMHVGIERLTNADSLFYRALNR